MSRIYVFGLAGIAALMMFASSGVAQTPARPLITSRINEENLVTLRGNTRQEANLVNDRGRVAGRRRICAYALITSRLHE